jgi:hypothetical protein
MSVPQSLFIACTHHRQTTGMCVTFNTHDRHEYEVKEEVGGLIVIGGVRGGVKIMSIKRHQK